MRCWPRAAPIEHSASMAGRTARRRGYAAAGGCPAGAVSSGPPVRPRSPGVRFRTASLGPGRVNLIGDHTDYNDGVALPMAIGLGVTVTFEPDRVGAHHLEGRPSIGTGSPSRGNRPICETSLLSRPPSRCSNRPGPARSRRSRRWPDPSTEGGSTSRRPSPGARDSRRARRCAWPSPSCSASRDRPRSSAASARSPNSGPASRWVRWTHWSARAHAGTMPSGSTWPPSPHARCRSRSMRSSRSSTRRSWRDSPAFPLRHDRWPECEAAAAVIGPLGSQRPPSRTCPTSGTRSSHPRARHVVTECARVGWFAEALAGSDLVGAGALLDREPPEPGRRLRTCPPPQVDAAGSHRCDRPDRCPTG